MIIFKLLEEKCTTCKKVWLYSILKRRDPDVEIIDNNDQNNQDQTTDSGSNGNLTDDNKNENGKNEVADGKVGTGDHSNIILYVVLMGIAAAVLAEMAIVTIKKRKAIKR